MVRQTFGINEPFQFTDGTKLLYADKNLKSLEETVNNELLKVAEWLNANKLTLNAKKFNLKNYNFLDCDWFKKLLFPTNSLVKLLSGSSLSGTMLSDSLLSDSSISQSHSKL